MNNKIKIYPILILHLLVAGPVVNAQVADTIKNNEVVTELPAEEVEVIKLFQARLEDAKKIEILPEAPPDRTLESFQYFVNIKPIELEYLDPAIKPIAMLSDPKPKIYNGFVRGGYGNLNTIDAALAYHYHSDKETELAIIADYLNINNKSRAFHKFQNANIQLDLNQNVNKLLSAGLGIESNLKDVYFFGSEIDSTETDSSKYQRRINKIGFDLAAYNSEINPYNFNYRFGLSYSNLQFSNENLAENNFKVSLTTSKSINKNFNVYLNGLLDLSTILDTSSLNYNNYFVNPGIKFSNSSFNAHAAMNVAFVQDQTHLLPDVKLSFSPIDYNFIPYAFWKSELQKNNLNNLIEVNPFLSSGFIQRTDNTIINQYGIGAKGIFQLVNYDIKLSYGTTENLILFDSELTQDGLLQFNILKDTAEIFQVNAGVEYDVNDNLSFHSDFTFKNYELKNNKRPWHLPTYQLDIALAYKLLEGKLLINPKLYLRQGVYVLDAEDQAQQLNPLIDFNFNIEYSIKERLSIFGKINNILASEYQLWDQYSYFGLNGIIGIKAVF